MHQHQACRVWTIRISRGVVAYNRVMPLQTICYNCTEPSSSDSLFTGRTTRISARFIWRVPYSCNVAHCWQRHEMVVGYHPLLIRIDQIYCERDRSRFHDLEGKKISVEKVCCLLKRKDNFYPKNSNKNTNCKHSTARIRTAKISKTC